MLKSIELCLEHRGRVSGQKRVTFNGKVNVIVGPNGSGKSSILKAIYKCPDCRKIEDSPTRYLFFDGEVMNPHISQKYFTGVMGSVVSVRSRYSSHGETVRDVLAALRFKPGDCFLLDEPQTGQDIRWILRIRKGVEMITKEGCQFIIASHHPVFWKRARSVELKKGYLNKTKKTFLKSIRD